MFDFLVDLVGDLILDVLVSAIHVPKERNLTQNLLENEPPVRRGLWQRRNRQKRHGRDYKERYLHE